jgi:hypothetical protein
MLFVMNNIVIDTLLCYLILYIMYLSFQVMLIGQFSIQDYVIHGLNFNNDNNNNTTSIFVGKFAKHGHKEINLMMV